MNRILKRPMFRIGGSAGTGITSGLDQPRKQYAGGGSDRMMSDAEKEERAYNLMRDSFDREEFLKERKRQMELDRKKLEEKRKGVAVADGGRIGYQQGSMPNFQMGGLPGFLTGFGLNLLATPPQGNIFQTAATAARDPFNRLQASQAAQMKTASDRAFAKELAAEEREFEEGQLEKRLDVERAKIDKMGGGDLLKRIESAKENYGGNEIKAAREIDFYDNKFTELQGNYGDEGVFIDPVDLSVYENQKNGLEKFVKQNPQAKRQVVYNVATGKAVRIVKDTLTDKLKVIPADSADMDTTGETQPAPEAPRSFNYLSEKQQQKLKEIQEGSDSEFGIGFYD